LYQQHENSQQEGYCSVCDISCNCCFYANQSDTYAKMGGCFSSCTDAFFICYATTCGTRVYNSGSQIIRIACHIISFWFDYSGRFYRFLLLFQVFGYISSYTQWLSSCRCWFLTCLSVK